ncbi:MAG: transporter [Sporomusa sp.]|nr:transporter [Sporomusa sp.]
MPINTAVSAVSTLGYLGILMGPALIGFIAHQTNLMFSFGLLAGLLLVLEGIAIYVYRVLDEKI